MSEINQSSLPVHSSRADAQTLLIPARMVNEWVYCPRLAYLEWVEGEWADTKDTVQGRRAHARVDHGAGRLASPEAIDENAPQARSVTMSSERLGVIAKMDVVDLQDGVAMPIDFKKGKRPHIAAGAYEPERVQVCVQAMILEDNGYQVDTGAIWYVGSRERVRVDLSDELRATTVKAIRELRAAAESRNRPPPLQDSPKCSRCSIAGICLPDETNLFDHGSSPRPLNPSADTALPLYVQTPGSRVRKKGERLVVTTLDDDSVEVPIIDVSQVDLFGRVSITTPALHALMRREIPVCWFSTGGWFLGNTVGTGNRNVAVREAQYRAAFSERRSLSFAGNLVNAKVRNCRTMLRRNWRPNQNADTKQVILKKLGRIARKALYVDSTQRLLGLEGEAAAIYFSNFEAMLRSDNGGVGSFSFSTRNRRPPLDPINAMLSFAYALLTRALTTTLSVTGLDPFLGLYHRPRPGRPALALDLMEPFRPILADSCVISAVNNGEVKLRHFVSNGPACSLNPKGRKILIAAFERRLQQMTTHPVFGYRISMRRILEVQARLLARHFQNEIAIYPHYLPR